MLAAEEYALIEAGLPGVKYADWGPFRRFKYSEGDEWFEFTGKKAGRTKCGSVDAEKKCAEYTIKYEKMKADAKRIIAKSSG